MTIQFVLRQVHDGNTALHLAAFCAEQHRVETPLSSMTSENLAVTNEIGATPLHVTKSDHERQGEGAIKVLPAIQDAQRNEMIAQSLLMHIDCKDLGVQDFSQRIVLHLALRKGLDSIVLSLLDNITASEHLGLQDCNAATALHLSARRGRLGIIRRHLMHQVSTATRDCYGRTPSHVAALAGELQHEEVIRRLLAHGANVKTDFDGWTALHSAAKRNKRATASISIKVGAEVDAVTTQG